MRIRHRLSPFLVLAAVAGLNLNCASPNGPSDPNGDIWILYQAVSLGTQGFTPNPLFRVAVSDTKVTWVNRDYGSASTVSSTGTSHHLISDQGLFDSGDLSPRASFTFTFPGPGTYGYRCLNHPSMIGSITITQ